MNPRKKRILIVDDDQDIRLGLGLRLRDLGYEPCFAENCVGALVQACAESPDLILLDVGLPGEDGHVVLGQLAQIPEAHQIPVFMIRVAEGLELGELDEDEVWRRAVEKTGGRFYAAANEDAIFRASKEIDELSAGRIDVKRYTAYRPRFGGYALVAVLLWMTAAVLKLGFRQFRTFP